MIGYLADTCIVSNWYAGNQPVKRRIMKLPSDSLFYVSVITLGEITHGHLSQSGVTTDKQKKFNQWINTTFEHPLALSKAEVEHYGIFRTRLFHRFAPKVERRRPESCIDTNGNELGINENDLWLVAQAASRNLTFLTNDAMTNIRAIVDNDVKIEVWETVD